jgi:TolB-like protein
MAEPELLRLTIFGRFCARDALGNEISIKSKKSRALLAYLALPPCKERSREEIMALLWSDRADDQARSSLRQALSGLRKELGKERISALRISDEVLSLDPDRVIVEPASPGEILLQGLHLSDPAFDEWLRDERLRHDDGSELDRRPPELPLPDKPSIAVLPFDNMSGDPEQEYFSDGITDDIITELSRFRSLFVIARSSSFRYKGQSPNVQDVGRELGVEYVVEGSVRRAGDRVRVTAQLVEAKTGNHLWAERYDRDLEDIFAVQDELVGEIASSVPGQLAVAAIQRAQRRPVDNLSAYDCVMRGEWLLNRDYGSYEALALFERAIKIDPQCARAYTRLAAFHAYSVFAHGTSVGEAAARARLHAERALEIDPTDSAIQATVAEAYHIMGDFDLARRHIEEAIKLNPNDYIVLDFAGVIFLYLGDHDEGLTWLHRLSRHDPFSSDFTRELFFDLYYMTRRYEEAIAVFRGWHNPPSHMYMQLAATYAQLDQMDEARTAMAQHEQTRPAEFNTAQVALAHAQVCARRDDGEHGLEGYRKAGLAV